MDKIQNGRSSELQSGSTSGEEKERVRKLLILFQRAVFRANHSSENSVKMLDAIRSTRISLQMEGATLVENLELARLFQNIIDTLQDIEFAVMGKFPDVERAIRNSVDHNLYDVPNNMDAVDYMIESRYEITELVLQAENIYRKM